MRFASILLSGVLSLVGVIHPGDAVAAVAGTGTFTMTIDTTGSPPYPMSGTIIWNDEARDVFGQNVNLGTSVETMSVDGFLTVVVPGTGTYTGTADGSPDLTFAGPDGDYLSSGSSLYSFVNSAVGLTGDAVGFDPTDLPPDEGNPVDIAYTQDGAGTCSIVPGATICSGTLAMNAFAAVPVSTGLSFTSINTSFFNPITGTEVPVSVGVLGFAQSAGDFQVTATSRAAGSIASNFAIEVGGWKAAFFDITGTAVYSGTRFVCTTYPDADQDGVVDGTESANGGMGISECDMRLLHNVGGAFQDVTLQQGSIPPCEEIACTGESPRCIDTVGNSVCGQTGSFSPFVAAADLSPAVPALSLRGVFALGSVLALAGAARIRSASRRRRGALV
jgi:hypothetical protein